MGLHRRYQCMAYFMICDQFFFFRRNNHAFFLLPSNNHFYRLLQIFLGHFVPADFNSSKCCFIDNIGQLRTACPQDYEPNPQFVALAGERVTIVRDPREAVKGAHLVSTDVWTSMGQEEETAKRLKQFAPYQVNKALLVLAAEDVLFMHCLPAHRGEEISVDLLDDPRSVAWDQAENRLHAQKALLEFLVQPAYHHA